MRRSQIAASTGAQIYVFAHAGDGNLHPIIVVDQRTPPGTVPPQAQAAADQIFALALALGGTISAEHGAGLLEKDWVARELGPRVTELQHQIKHLLHPLRILNPGKAL